MQPDPPNAILRQPTDGPPTSARDDCFGTLDSFAQRMVRWDVEQKANTDRLLQQITQLQADKQVLLNQCKDQLHSQEMRHQAKELQSLQSAPNDTVQWLRERYNSLQADHYRLEGQRTYAQEMEEKYKKELVNLRLALSDLKKERDDLQHSLDITSQQLDHMADEKMSIYMAQHENLEQLAEVTLKMSDIKDKLDESTEQHQAAMNQLQEATAQLQAAISQRDSLRAVYRAAAAIAMCGICMETMSTACPPRGFHCGHLLCESCSKEWIDVLHKRSCPMCRKDVSRTRKIQGLAEIFDAVTQAAAATED
ncbi:hypothetical protein HGRIS_000480 [Hohenbuehelia grisea]|uniref:RING-type domain-containing protein n=1 Tax=Hohenbuehelia grisea TaxID=104357 RepID=A0ABR3JSJ3_9AGAR